MHTRLKSVRKYLNLSQSEFGSRIGVQNTAISKLESGERNFTDQMILALCKEYKINEVWFRTGDGEMFVETENVLISQLSAQYGLDDLDQKILEIYVSLPEAHRAVIKDFARKFSAAADDDTVRVYRAAKSEDNRPGGIVDVPRSLIRKLQEAPTVKSDDEI